MKNSLQGWKDPAILLTSIGISGTGDFIYLVTINIIVYQLTGSAAAVAGSYRYGGNNQNCTGVIISGIGHGVSFAEPDFYNRMIEKWINEGIPPKGTKAIR